MDQMFSKVVGWEYVFIHNGAMGVGKVVETNINQSLMTWSVKCEDGLERHFRETIDNNSIMDSAYDPDQVIDHIKKVFDENRKFTEEEKKALKEHIRGESG
jgi:hypothetical protein